jgi:putative endonuclease
MKHGYVYMMASQRNGTLYIGVTSDLVKRVYEHKTSPLEGFTQKYGIKMLVWFQQCDDIAGAILREKQMKKWNRSWKIREIEAVNPEWRDLYEDII